MYYITIKDNLDDYVFVRPDLSDFEILNKKPTKFKNRIEVSGSVKFSGLDYELISEIETDIIDAKLYQNGNFIAEIQSSKSAGFFDVNNSLCILEFFTNDVFSVVEAKKNIKYNCLSLGTRSSMNYEVLTSFEFKKVETDIILSFADFAPDFYFDYVDPASPTNTAPQEGITPPTDGDETIWVLFGAFYSDIELIDMVSANAVVNYTFITEIGLSTSSTTPLAGSGWFLISELANGLFKWGRRPDAIPLTDYIYTNSGTITINRIPVSPYWPITFRYLSNSLTNKEFTYSKVYNFNNTGVDLSNITRKILAEIDSTLNFDDSGTVTDSFYEMENFDVNGDKVFNSIILQPLSNTIPASAYGILPENPATVAMLSFEQIEFLLNKLGFDWTIENREGLNTFVIKHVKNIDVTPQDVNLLSFKGMNFNFNANKYEFLRPDITSISYATVSNDIDFFGGVINFNNVQPAGELSLSEAGFYTDYEHILSFPETYNSNSIDEFVIFAINSELLTIKSEGILTSITLNNIPLSFPFLVKHTLHEYPSISGIMSGILFEFETWQLAKNKEFSLILPINNILSDIDISQYLTFLDVETECIEISQKGNEATAKVKLRQ